MIKRLGSFAIGIMALLVVGWSPAKADSLSFNSNNSNGSNWTLSGGPLVFSLSSALTSVQLDSNSPTSIGGGTISWTTGPASFPSSSLIIFNPGGSITVTGDLGSGVVALFTGSFQSGSLTALSGGAPGESSFSASFVAGNINPALYAFLGASGLSPDVTGTLTATLIDTFTTSGGSGLVGGAAISLDPIPSPEPATLSLLTPALLGLALLKKRFRAGTHQA